MFTTGSKFFIGASTLAVAGTLIFGGINSGGPLGTLGLIGAAIGLVFMTGMNFWVRDSNVSSKDPAAIDTCAASHHPVQRSLWPIVAGIGVALLSVGLIVGYAVVWIAVIVLLIATVEWMVLSWSEQASGDVAYNSGVRKRIMHPMELPILGAIGAGLIIFSFSRIMLSNPGTAGILLFGGIASVIVLFGALMATKRNVGKSVVTALCTVGAVALIGAGVASALEGGHTIEKHEINEVSSEGDTCGAELTEADEDPSRAIPGKSNPAATVILENGTLRAEVIGIAGNPEAVTLLRSNNNYVRFRNMDDGTHRLRAFLGYEVVAAGTAAERSVESSVCTQAITEGGEQFLIVNPSRPSVAAPADEQYQFTVPGVDTAVLRIVVP